MIDMQTKNYWNKNENEFGARGSQNHMHDKLPLIDEYYMRNFLTNIFVDNYGRFDFVDNGRK